MGDGETDTLTFTVYRGWIDITKSVTSWKITRDSASPTEDAAWNLTNKAKNFDGTIQLLWSDLGTNASIQYTIFNAEAIGDDGTVMAKAEVTI